MLANSAWSLACVLVALPIEARACTGLSAQQDAGVGRPAQEPASAEQSIRTKVIGLIEQQLAASSRVVDRTLSLLHDGKTAEARAAMARLHRSHAQLRRDLRWIKELTPEQARSLSLLKVRIIRARPHSEAIAEDGDEESQAWGRFLGRFTWSVQDIDAQVLESIAVGRAFRSNTLAGIRHPSRMRSDLEPGRTVALRSDRGEGSMLIDTK